MFNSVVSSARELFGGRLLVVAVFGSSVYYDIRSGDIDVLVVVDEELSFEKKLSKETELSIKLLRASGGSRAFDVHVMDVRQFQDNLKPGTFLSGLVLGYRVLYDRIGFKGYVEKLFQRLVDENYVLVNK
ncbi:MAG: hypothetical protein NXY59_00265 [Aigarchaeota archaeon]|nr:hypothetical protein [Candidatus Pelearchaeum maunauluense]